jgi:hypothetical protein
MVGEEGYFGSIAYHDAGLCDGSDTNVPCVVAKTSASADDLLNVSVMMSIFSTDTYMRLKARYKTQPLSRTYISAISDTAV